MKVKLILASLVLLTFRVASQDVSNSQTAQCRFSDGKKITVTYSSGDKSDHLVTETELVTIKGTLPAGEYTIVRRLEFPNKNRDLIITKLPHTPQSSDLILPMSVSTSSSPSGSSGISFDHAGGTCILHWALEKSNSILSLEFAEKNTDLPVQQ